MLRSGEVRPAGRRSGWVGTAIAQNVKKQESDRADDDTASSVCAYNTSMGKV